MASDGEKPKIYIISMNFRGARDVRGGALAEDGTGLAGHLSSNLSFARHDMGLTSGWKHDLYRKHYPDGYELVDLMDLDDLSQHAGYMAAFDKNRAMAASKPGGPDGR